MLDWIKNRGLGTLVRPDDRPAAAAFSVAEIGNVGEYQLLYKYLNDRFANRVVLTFSEIEDLLGFMLPAPARLRQDWWGTTDAIAPRSAQSDSWVLANRTAAVNMTAQTVVFDRQTPPESRRR